MMAAPKVYTAISKVAAELSTRGIGKQRINADDGYSFRGIDDIYNFLSPLLVRHKLCLLPEVLEHSSVRQHAAGGETLNAVNVKAAFHFVSAIDGSRHTVHMVGEALDSSDKATAKAMAAAFKCAAIQAFCIPISGSPDPDFRSPKPLFEPAQSEPVQGWEQWTTEIGDMIAGCLTDQALAIVQQRYKAQLRSLSLSSPGLFSLLGEAFSRRRRELSLQSHTPTAAIPPATSARRRKRKTFQQAEIS